MFEAETHCNESALRSFVLDRDAEPDESILHHIEHCQACQQRLDELAAEEQLWNRAERAFQTNARTDLKRSPQQVLDQSDWIATSGYAPRWTEAMASKLLAPPTHPEMLGRLGRYEVERLVGSGGMGIVFKAFDTELNRPVAVKLLAPHLAHSQSARERFSREARAAAGIVDDHVVPIYNVEAEAESPFLVMQYVAGGSLQQRLDRDGPLELSEVLRIGMQTALGLAAAHNQGLIHRDVKPSNVLLDEDVSRAVLTDFGLARADDEQQLTHSGYQPGTPQYMSPEQVRGEDIDGQSDLFSLGCLLFSLCTGHPPFRGKGSFATLKMIIDEPAPSIFEQRPDLPRWLNEVIMRLLSKQPRDRFESAEEVATLLEACLAHVRNPAVCSLPSQLTQIPERSNFVRRHGGLLAIGSFVFLLFFASIAILIDWKKGQIKITLEESDGRSNSSDSGSSDTRSSDGSKNPGAISPLGATEGDSVAVVYLLHPGELPSGRTIVQIATPQALSELRDQDHCGCLAYSSEGTQWIWGGDDGLSRLGDHRFTQFFEFLDTLPMGDFPEFDTALQMALNSLKLSDAAERRLIVLTDGDPVLEDEAILDQYKAAGIEIDVIHVEIHDPRYRKIPQSMTEKTGGSYVRIPKSAAAKTIPNAMAARTRNCVSNLPPARSVAPVNREGANTGVEGGSDEFDTSSVSGMKQSNLKVLTATEAIEQGKELWHNRERVKVRFQVESNKIGTARDSKGKASEWHVLQSKPILRLNQNQSFSVWVPKELANTLNLSSKELGWVEVEGRIVGTRRGGIRIANDPRPDTPTISIRVTSPDQLRFFKPPLLPDSEIGNDAELEVDQQTKTQVLFSGSGIAGASLRLQRGKVYTEAIQLPARHNFAQAALHSFEITNASGSSDKNLFATLEVRSSVPATKAYLLHNAVPVEISLDDLENVNVGNLVTKVIYLPEPEFQAKAIGGIQTIVSTQIDSGIDPVELAEQKGTVLLILRLGTKDSSFRSNEYPEDSPSHGARKNVTNPSTAPFADTTGRRIFEEFERALENLESGGDRLRKSEDGKDERVQEDGSYVQVPLRVDWHENSTMHAHLGQRVVILADGIVRDKGTPNTQTPVQVGVFHDCRLESFKLFTLGKVDYWYATLFVPRNAKYKIGSLWYKDPHRTMRIGDRHTPVPAATLAQKDPQAKLLEELKDGFHFRLDNSTEGDPRFTAMDAPNQKNSSINDSQEVESKHVPHLYWVQPRPEKIAWNSEGTSEVLADNSIQLQGAKEWQEFSVRFARPPLVEISHVRLEVLTSSGELAQTGEEAEMVLFDVKPFSKSGKDKATALEFDSCTYLGDENDTTASNCIDWLSDTGWTVPALNAQEACHTLVLDFAQPIALEANSKLEFCIDSGGAADLKTLPRVRLSFAGKRVPAKTSLKTKISPGTLSRVVLEDVPFDFHWCPPGNLLMGSTPGTETQYGHQFKKQHGVKLPQGFWLLGTEVTQAQYVAIMGENPSFWIHQDDRHPVEQVTWDDANRFCKKMSELDERYEYRLPSEAEWEYACRAGDHSPRYGEILDIAWVFSNTEEGVEGSSGHRAAGMKSSNAWGFHDMFGNVAEWCSDIRKPRDITAGSEPDDPSEGSRAVRGGDCFACATFLREDGACMAASSLAYPPSTSSRVIGFRIVRVASSPEATQ